MGDIVESNPVIQLDLVGDVPKLFTGIFDGKSFNEICPN